MPRSRARARARAESRHPPASAPRTGHVGQKKATPADLPPDVPLCGAPQRPQEPRSQVHQRRDPSIASRRARVHVSCAAAACANAPRSPRAVGWAAASRHSVPNLQSRRATWADSRRIMSPSSIWTALVDQRLPLCPTHVPNVFPEGQAQLGAKTIVPPREWAWNSHAADSPSSAQRLRAVVAWIALWRRLSELPRVLVKFRPGCG